MKSVGIRFRMILGVVVVLALGGGLIAWMLQGSYEANLDRAASTAVASAQANFAAVQRAEETKLYTMLDVLMTDNEITEAFAARDRERLSEITIPRYEVLKERQGVNRWYFYMPLEESTVFLRAYRGEEALDPENWGDVTDRATYFKAAESGERVSGFELGRTALAIRGAAPYVVDGEDLGVMAVGTSIDDFLPAVTEQTGDQYGMYLDKEFFDAEAWAEARASSGLEDNWGDYESVVLAYSTVEDADLLAFDGTVADVPDGGMVLDRIESGGRTYVRGAFPVYEAGDSKVAAIYVLHDITDTIEQLRATQATVLLGVAGLMVVLSIVILVMLNKLVFVRLDSMISHIEEASLRLAGGDYDVSMPAATSNDEIGSFEKFVGNFITMMAQTLKSLSGK